MSLIFPSNPTVGQTTYTGDNFWSWDGERWYIIPSTSGYTGSIGFTGSAGLQGPAGGYTGSAGFGRPVAVQVFVSTSSSTYTLNSAVTHPLQIMVIVNGLVQIPFTDYSVSGTTLTFITLPPVGSDVEILYFNSDPLVGYRGSAGVTGYTGSIGASGINGFVGSRGFTGSIGFTGSRGDTGFIGSTGAVGAPDYSQKIVSTGAGTYALDRQVLSPNHIIVSVNGLVQMPTTDYQIIALSTIGLVNPPPVGSDIEIRYFALATTVGYRGSAGSAGPGYTGSIGFQGSTGQGGFSAVYIGPNADPSAFNGELWYDTDNGILSIYDSVANAWIGIGPGLRGGLGYTGSSGSPGGYTGSRGDVGFIGSLGFTGSQGTGFTGSAGTGFSGSAGTPGYTGSKGDPTGYTGSAGFGYTGSIGQIGYTGSIGAGYTGSIGAVGYTGSSGGGSGTGLSPRAYKQGLTSGLAAGATTTFSLSSTAKTYALLKIFVSQPAWIRIYDSAASRTSDATRIFGQEPSYNSGVIAEVVTSSPNETINFTPGVIGMNNETPVADVIYVTATNLSTGTVNLAVGLTYVSLEG